MTDHMEEADPLEVFTEEEREIVGAKTPRKRAAKKAPAADLGLNPATIRARAIVLGRLKG